MRFNVIGVVAAASYLSSLHVTAQYFTGFFFTNRDCTGMKITCKDMRVGWCCGQPPSPSSFHSTLSFAMGIPGPMHCDFEPNYYGNCLGCISCGGTSRCYPDNYPFAVYPAQCYRKSVENEAMLHEHSMKIYNEPFDKSGCQQPRYFVFESGHSYDLTSVSQKEYEDAIEEFLKGDQQAFHNMYKNHFKGIEPPMPKPIMGERRMAALESKEKRKERE